ncbi:unnamed protein product [Staurois parvus]|uniref:Uncharacterized protein n=1 Tax=Staurois parvus TaxID=386267 RepID=A0ABN9BQG8_9NEOB|nr:unnamed protein product [Staurois parvus]
MGRKSADFSAENQIGRFFVSLVGDLVGRFFRYFGRFFFFFFFSVKLEKKSADFADRTTIFAAIMGKSADFFTDKKSAHEQ